MSVPFAFKYCDISRAVIEALEDETVHWMKAHGRAAEPDEADASKVRSSQGPISFGMTRLTVGAIGLTGGPTVVENRAFVG